MRKRINDDHDEYIYIYVFVCEYIAECDLIMTIDSVAVVGLILLLVASVVVNDDGQLWRLHEMGQAPKPSMFI